MNGELEYWMLISGGVAHGIEWWWMYLNAIGKWIELNGTLNVVMNIIYGKLMEY